MNKLYIKNGKNPYPRIRTGVTNGLEGQSVLINGEEFVIRDVEPKKAYWISKPGIQAYARYLIDRYLKRLK